MKMQFLFNFRICLIHRLYTDLNRLIKRIIRLMPSCIVFLGLITLLLLTLVQLVTVQPEFIQTLPEPSELIRNLNSTNLNTFNNLTSSFIQNSSSTNSKSLISSSALTKISNSFSKSSFSSTTLPSSFKSANLTNSINLTNHDYLDQLNRPGLSHMIISSNRTSLMKAKKSDPFKIEALLSKSPSAFQLNNREMNSLTNKGRLKQIIKNFLSEKRQEKERSNLDNMTIYLNDTIISKQHKNQTYEHCPLIPPNLVGRMKVDLNINNLKPDFLNQTKLENNYIEEDGFFRPTFCIPLHKVAIIIPYRDREQHLHILLKHLHGVLQRQLLLYKIFVIEQNGNDTFNKGVLMNAGAKEAASQQHIHCFIFHDVDLIPEDDRTLYSCPNSPRHLSVSVNTFNYTLPYSYLIGGVFAISQAHFNLVNGYSNLYWSWGGEDDDLSHRLKLHSLHIIRPPSTIGRYTMIKHQHRQESPKPIRYSLLRMATKRSSRDGLSSVHYKVVGRKYEPKFGYEHIIIQIDSIHQWHFQGKNKLIIHF